MAQEKDYVLGTHAEEIERLGLQHRLWRPRAQDAWRRAGFAEGQTLLDIGCGPGWATLDLAEIVGPTGRVIAVDRSRRFLDTLEAAARARGFAQIETREQDLDLEPLPEAGADGAWSRWVFAFVKRPRALVERTARALRPGGRLVLHEYGAYQSWRLGPPSSVFERFVQEVMASWRDNGGEPDIGLALPGWLEETGFRVLELRPIVEVARPADAMWDWPRAFVEVGLARLVELGRMSEAEARATRDAFETAGRTPSAFLITPLVLEIIAERR